MLSFVCWILFSVIFVSFAEYTIHRFFMHRRILSEGCYKIKFINQTFENHALGHHKKYYKIFNQEDDPNGKWLNIHLEIWVGFLLSLLIALPLAFVSLLGATTFICIVISHHLFWNLIHEEMHIPKKRWFSNTRIYKYLARYHYMHHKHTGKNFNVVFPLADFIFRTNIKATPNNIEEMKELGLF